MNNVDIFNICLAKKLSGGGGGTYESKSVTPDFSNGDITVSPDEGYDALSSVTIEKDAGLIADNIRKDTEIFGITGTLDGGSDTATLDALIDGSLTSISNNRVTTIGKYAFYYHSGLTSVNFPNVESVGVSAFSGCSTLTTVDIPNLTSLPTSIFNKCEGLTSINFPNVTSIGNSALSGCSRLTSVDFPNATIIDSNAFSSCSRLTTADIPNATSIVQSAFYNCASLTSADFPKVTSIGNNAFQNCSSLTTVNFSSVTSIGNTAFRNCLALSTVILRKSDSICTLGNTNAFLGTPFANGSAGGTLYVPQALIASYQADTNWSTVLGWNANNKILAIEGSIYE